MSRILSVLTGTAAARPAAGGGATVRAGAEPIGPGSVLRGDPVPGVAARPAPAVAVAEPARDPAGTDGDAEPPYVEIGGPEGLVFSPGRLARVIPAPVADRAAAPPPAAAPAKPRDFPRLAEPPRYLSVTFHDLTGIPRPAATTDGVDAGLVTFYLPDHPVSGEYRTLRDEIRGQLPDPGARVLFLTAAAPEAGTTTVLLNLAVTLAREDAVRVLVVDATTPAPRASAVAQKLGVKANPGLADVLAQQVPLAWAVQSSAVPNLQVLTAGALSGERLAAAGEDLPRLVQQLRQWYDWVLVDAGVWGAEPDRDAVCPAADAVYLVTREADTDRPEFAGLRGWVKQLGGLLRGYITTRV